MNYFENSILLKAQLSKLNFLDMWICFKKWILLIKWIFSLQYLPGKSEAIFSRSSSTSGTDSSIRIRKAREGCTERRWFISVSLALIFTVLVASAGIYFGCKFNFRAKNKYFTWRENSNIWRNSDAIFFWFFDDY
mgnify:CR=1 FL=1